jgi:autotransporter translocation and assembly factor TamB
MDEEGRVKETTVDDVAVDDVAVEDGASDATAAASDGPRRRPLWRRALRWGRWSVAVLLLLAVVFFTQTGRGQRIVVDELLERVQGSLAGELTVEGVRSSALIFGATLTGVRMDAEGGRRFLEADSAVLRYSPLSLALGSPRLRSTTFHGLDVEISRYPGDDFTNVDRLLKAGPEDGPAPGAPQTIGLGRLAVRRGSLQILTPSTDAPESLSVPAPGGGLLRRIALEDLDLDLERTVFRSDGPVMVDARLASLSAAIFLQEKPLLIREAQGDLTFGDRGLRVQGGQFRLPGSFVEGGLALGPDRPGDPWTLTVGFRSEDWSDLADIGWVDPRMPEGRFRGQATLRVEEDLEISLRGVDVESGASSVVLDGGVRFADVMSMQSLRITAEPLDLSLVEPWLEDGLALEGSVRGNALVSGTFSDLSTSGRLTVTPDLYPEAVTTADFRGTIHTGADPGATDLEVRLGPFDYRVLEPYWSDAVQLGTGRAVFSAEGRAGDGMLVVADVVHRSDPFTTSRAVGRGMIRRDQAGDWSVDVRGELTTLSLQLIGRLWPQVDLPGSVSGPVRVNGRVTDLTVEGDLTGEVGRLEFSASADMTAPEAGYVVEAIVEELDLSALTTSVPSPSLLSGRVTVDGEGFALDSLRGSAEVAVSSARVGGLVVDSSAAALDFERGLLTAREVHASVAGILIEGGGSIGVDDERSGEARFEFSGETLEGLRPVFMGDSILVADTLTPLEGDALRARGIDPDTLPTALDVRMEGALKGTADVRGRLGDFDLDLLFDLAGGAYGHNSVDSARVSLMASGLPETMGEWDVQMAARQLVAGQRVFQRVNFDGAMNQRAGEGALAVVRRPNEGYELTGAFALDSVGGVVELTEAEIRVDSRSWLLSRPTTIAWNETSLTVDSLEVRSAGTDPMLVTAAGTVTRGGDSDFRLLMEGFHVEEALRLAQRGDIDLVGHIDLALDIVGPAERPVMQARFEVVEPRYGPVRLSRLDGTLEYENRLAALDLSAWVDDRRVFTGDGVIPIDLALTDVEDRAVGEDMDLTLRADSLDAALALVYLDALEDVVGTVSAEMSVGGTIDRPQPRGTVTLSRAGWTLPAIGVRHTDVSGELLLQPDGTVGIKLATAGGARIGASTISGIVQLDPLTNPTLDLAINFNRFLAVDRRDIQGRISGDLTLTGRYQLPVAEGTLRMDEGTLYVEEFVRAAEVVDLRSPLLYAPTMAVDTAVFVSQPLIAGLSNPFLDNLRVDVDLAVPRNLWLRSPDMNVELGGDLIVRYDRREGDLVLVGELEALRGSYSLLGRTFVVDGGTAFFIGQPGVNPSLDIQALSRVRRRESDPLEVTATVGGTLAEPLVTLSTEEAGVSQSDLITYLLIGRSAAEVGPQAEVIRSGVGTYLTGAVVSQLGTAIAQELPLVNQLDYLSFSSSAAIGQGDVPGSAFGTALGSTQVELGKYLNDRVFVVFVLGGTEGDQESGASLQLRGVRLELALDDSFYLEGFMEDRFLRTGSTFGSADLDGTEILGFFLFGEWGFGSRQQD